MEWRHTFEELYRRWFLQESIWQPWMCIRPWHIFDVVWYMFDGCELNEKMESLCWDFSQFSGSGGAHHFPIDKIQLNELHESIKWRTGVFMCVNDMGNIRWFNWTANWGTAAGWLDWSFKVAPSFWFLNINLPIFLLKPFSNCVRKTWFKFLGGSPSKCWPNSTPVFVCIAIGKKRFFEKKIKMARWPRLFSP